MRVRQRGRQAAHALPVSPAREPQREHGGEGFAIDLRLEDRGAELRELRLGKTLRLRAERRPGLREHDGIGNRPARDPLLHLDHADLLGRQLSVELKSLHRDDDQIRFLDGVADD